MPDLFERSHPSALGSVINEQDVFLRSCTLEFQLQISFTNQTSPRRHRLYAQEVRRQGHGRREDDS